MDDDLDFTAEEFQKMSNAQRIGLCRRLAERARMLADISDPNHREPYLHIAGGWDKLAEELERQK